MTGVCVLDAERFIHFCWKKKIIIIIFIISIQLIYMYACIFSSVEHIFIFFIEEKRGGEGEKTKKKKKKKREA